MNQYKYVVHLAMLWCVMGVCLDTSCAATPAFKEKLAGLLGGAPKQTTTGEPEEPKIEASVQSKAPPEIGHVKKPTVASKRQKPTKMSFNPNIGQEVGQASAVEGPVVSAQTTLTSVAQPAISPAISPDPQPQPGAHVVVSAGTPAPRKDQGAVQSLILLDGSLRDISVARQKALEEDLSYLELGPIFEETSTEATSPSAITKPKKKKKAAEPGSKSGAKSKSSKGRAKIKERSKGADVAPELVGQESASALSTENIPGKLQGAQTDVGRTAIHEAAERARAEAVGEELTLLD